MAIKDCNKFVVCVGHPKIRCFISDKLISKGLSPLIVIDNNSIVEEDCQLGKEVQFMPGSLLRHFSKIGDYSIMNTGCSVDHDCKIGMGVHIMGSATLAGNVNIGNYSTVGTNATILPNIVVGSESYIGAGAVVTKNVPNNSVVVGVPAQKLKDHSENFENTYENLFY